MAGHGVSFWDYVVILVYLVATIWIGLWFAGKQKSLKDYFLAGRDLHWFPVAISIISTDLSGISYMGLPAWVFEKNLIYPTNIFLFPFVMYFVTIVIVPLFYMLQLYTIYQYLQKRFNNVVRTFASTIFILMRTGWLATAIFTQSLVMEEMLHIPMAWCAIGIGMLTTIYTFVGGMEAVVWTDFMHFFVLVGGILVMIGYPLYTFGWNFGSIWHIAAQGGHTQLFNFSPSLHTEVTDWGLLLGIPILYLSSYGADQIVMQRYFTTKSVKESAKAVFWNGIIVIPVVVGLALAGICFIAYYHAHPELMATLKDTNHVVPHFIVSVLPPGLMGIVFAGILAANMNVISAGVNSLSTSTIIDYYHRFIKGSSDKSDHYQISIARYGTFAWGAIITTASFFVGKLGGIVQIYGKISSFLSGPLVGLFLLGLLTKRATSWGSVIGGVLGFIATFFVANYTTVSWIWYGLVGCVVTMVGGYLCSLFMEQPAADVVEKYTYWGSRNALKID
jgi:SSS family transporter